MKITHLIPKNRKNISRLLCIAAFSSCSIFSYAQQQQIHLSGNNIPLKTVFKQIEKQTKLSVDYRANDLNDGQIIQNMPKAGTVEQALLQLLSGTDCIATFSNGHIIIKKRLDFTNQQVKTIKGTVIDASGEPLIGANVMVKGTTNGTITDLDGAFSLEISEGQTLVITYIGYKTHEIKIGNVRNLTITLEEDSKALEELVVVGYGIMKKSDLTGAVGSVKAKDIQKMPVASVDQALQGKVSGMQITTASGAPGSNTTIRIRGGNSINAGNEPLYVIDGIIGGGDLSTINPSDIESIEVLKDASSTAIYGSRGANGVVLITTKRGEGANGPRISYNGYYGIQTPIKKIDFLDGREAAEFQNEYAEYYNRPKPFKDVNAVTNTDWQEYIYKDVASVTDHNLSVSNATKNTNYFLSFNYYNQEGLMYKTGFERYQIRFNVDQEFNEHFKLGATLTTSLTNRDNPSLYGVDLLPTAPVYNEDGHYFDVNQISGTIYNNPVALREGILNETRKVRGLGNVYLQITPIKNLIIKSSWGFDVSHTKQNRYESVKLPSRIFNKTGGFAAVNTNFPISYQNENTVNYILDLKDHSFSFLGGFTWQKFQSEFSNVSASGFTNDVSSFNAIETGDPVTRNIQTGEQEWGLLSYLFRLNYSYKNKYMVTVSGRQDGSSRLSKDNRWAFFPSAALAWRASEEQFIKDLNVFSNLKFRLSYGSSGSQSINPYSVIDRLNSGSTVIGNKEVITFAPGLSASKNLKWEKTNQIDLGIDAGFFNNRLSVELDYYYKETNDLLLSKEIPFQTGYGSMLQNVGSVTNQGIEFTVRSTNIQTQDWQWDTSVSISANRNKVTNLGGKDYIENGRGSRLIVNEPLGAFWGVKYLGTWKEDELEPDSKFVPGDPKLEDLNKDGIIDMNDGQIIGRAEPKFYGGINSELRYKRLTLNLFFDYSYGNELYDLSGRSLETGFNCNVYKHNKDRWTESNPNGYYPRAGSSFRYIHDTYAGGEFNGGCSLYVHDGSYLRLKNINLQYDVPIKAKFIKSLQVYGTISNLFTLTSYQGYSPDVSAEGTSATRRGFDGNGYPQNKTFLLGLKANF